MSKFRYLLFLALFSPLLASGGSVERVKVNVQGEGNSYQEALNNALVEAIGQIHGKSIDSQKMTLSIEASTVSNESEEYFSSDEYLSLVKEKTKGAVSAYEVLNADDSSGRWILDVVAQVAKYKRTKSANRKRIVIAQSSVGQATFPVLGQNIKAREMAEKMDQSMADSLVQTRKFAVLDRQNNAVVESELALAKSTGVSTEETARIGQTLVSDFVLVGTLDQMQYSTTTKTMLTSEKTYMTGSGNASYSYSFIEVATSQVFFSDTVKASISHNEISRAARSNPDQVGAALVEALSNKLVKKLVDQIYPLAILSRRNDEVILSEGGKRLSAGDSYKVYKRGEKIYDPYTKEFTGYEEFYCCTVQVSRVGAKQSYAIITDGNETMPITIPAKKFVLRDKVVEAKQKLVKSENISTEDNDW